MEPTVVLPQLRPEAERARPTGAGTGPRAGDIRDALASLGDGEGRDGFHLPLRTAIMRYARRCVRYNDRDDGALKQQLRDAIEAAPRRPDRDLSTYLDDAYLQRSIDGAFALLAADEDIQTMRPHHARPEHTVDEGREAIAEHVASFLDRALEWHRTGGEDPEHAALVVGTGLGKSTEARKALAVRYIEDAKAAGASHRVLWLVPSHKLSNEALAAMEELGLSAAIMRGREALDPDHPDFDNPQLSREEKAKMCLDLEAVGDALKAHYELESAVCGKDEGPACAFWSQCPYQRQKVTVAQADVVIAAHQALFHPLPKVASDNVGLVIVDESWWQAGVVPNRETRLSSFAEEPLTHPVRRSEKNAGKYGRVPRADEFATNDLHALSAKAQAAFTATPKGEFVSKESLIAAGLTPEDCSLARKLEWRRKVNGLIRPGMPADQRKKARDLAAGNAAIPRRAAIWSALQESLEGEETQTGRLQMGLRSDKSGVMRVILLHSRLNVREAIAELPILALDATMPIDIVRYFLPRLEVLANIQAHAPHMKVHQIVGGWGKTSICPSDKAPAEENRRRENLLGELVDFVGLNSGGDGLVITYEAIEGRFRVPGIRTGHFNNIAGLDAFRDVLGLFVIGRPLPDPRELRADALALTGRPIPAETGHLETRGVLMADGTGVAMKVRVYSDPDLEALRVAITDAEVIQAIGRGRGVNRDASRPLNVFVCADVILPLPVNNLVRWKDVRPDPLARMVARGVVLLSPTDAAKAYPDLFPTSEAARKALERGEAAGVFTGHFPREKFSLGECPGNQGERFTPVTYQPTGRGQQRRRALAAASRLPTLRAWLEALVGPLTHFEVAPKPSSEAGAEAEPEGADPADDEPAASAESGSIRVHPRPLWPESPDPPEPDPDPLAQPVSPGWPGAPGYTFMASGSG
ncbi:MAG: hypothetical protein JO212_16145 [Acetobacteraceae bacterium]|nr:hypothetical protein [Acetobacteraceae bacterium]